MASTRASSASLGQHLPLARLLEQGRAEPRLEAAETTAHRGRIDAHRLPRLRQLPGPRDREKDLKVIPVECLHFCRS